MNYQATLEYIFLKLPMYQRIGSAAYKKDLQNTISLLNYLENPHHSFLTIHVAGTNGKGSVSNMLASILQEAGYTCGLYTSPHLIDFRERIRVNGEMCNENFVVDFIEQIKDKIEEIQPSFFEITVAMAFEYFKQEKVEIAVIETGLGGRLDSTNVIHPILSIITNISYDHTAMLGNTLAEIAFEKAGIIKKHSPVVIGEFHAETFPVFTHKAKDTDSALYLADENVGIDIIEDTLETLSLHVSYLNQLFYPSLISGLRGDIQIKNLKTVIQSIEVLRTNKLVELSDEDIYNGIANVIKNTGFAGRLQVISKQPYVLIDCAHNADGLKQLFSFLLSKTSAHIHVVTGMVNDKDHNNSLSQYPTSATYYFCKPNIPRGLHEESLSEMAMQFKLKGSTYSSVDSALKAALKNISENEILLVCGSIFVAAEAIQFFQT